MLRERKLSAYFCLVGRQLLKSQLHVDIAKSTLADGHCLVNHSYTHSTALGDEPSARHASHEVTEAHRLLCESLGDWGEPWFRPFGRGGEVGKHLLSAPAVSALEALQYSVLVWNCVPRDWENPQGWVSTALDAIARQSHTVLVLHDLDTGAMQHLAQFLDTCLERGDEFTLKLPDSCVPMREGQVVFDQHHFNGIVTAQGTA